MNEGVSEWDHGGHYLRGRVNGGHLSQNGIAKFSMFWNVDKGQKAGSARAALDKQFSLNFRLKLVSTLSTSWDYVAWGPLNNAQD